MIPLYYGSGSDFLTSYSPGSTRQKVKVTVPVPSNTATKFMIVVLLVVPEGESVRPGLLVEVHQHPLLQLILANHSNMIDC